MRYVFHLRLFLTLIQISVSLSNSTTSYKCKNLNFSKEVVTYSRSGYCFIRRKTFLFSSLDKSKKFEVQSDKSAESGRWRD